MDAILTYFAYLATRYGFGAFLSIVSLLFIILLIFLSVAFYIFVKVGGLTKFGKMEFGKQMSKNSFRLVQWEIQLFEEMREMTHRHAQMMYVDLIREEMIVTEGYLEEVKSVLLEYYANMVKKFFAERLSEERLSTFDEFERTLLLLEIKILAFYRSCARENHLAEKTEEEFIQYLRKKLRYLHTVFPSWLQSLYRTGPGIIPGEVFVKDFNILWERICPRFEQILREMRALNTRYAVRMKNEQEVFNRKRSEFFALIPTILSGVKVLEAEHFEIEVS